MNFTVNGKYVFAATGGRDFNPSQDSIIFLHGSGGDRTVWQLQTRYFAWRGRGVLAVDLPGHGKSDGPPIATIEAQAEWVIELMAAACIDKAALVGHSMGAALALHTAGAFPERVSAVSMCGVSETMPVHPELLQAAQDGDHHALDLITSWGLDRRAHVGGHKIPGAWMTGGTMRLLARGLDQALGADLTASNAYQGGLEAAGKVQCPALFILGDRDKMTPVRSARSLIEAIDGSVVEIIPNCGHMMMTERPDETLDALRRVL
ncbi:MAG: alpha/beta hydrolase [Rhodospirillaceae bacterium]|nr:alpha/beta hydrolase [Rhodospirillaceae bacterium]